MIATEIIRRRNELTAFLRRFFSDRGFLEIETPLLVEKTVPEGSIRLFRTESDDGFGGRQPLFLIPSPEVTMKKVLAAKPGLSIFQIGKSFRNGEVKTGIHSREFTMLEYYLRNADCFQTLDLTETLFAELPFGPQPVRRPFLKLTVDELFGTFLGTPLSILAVGNEDEMRRRLAEFCRKLGLKADERKDNAADLFHLLFVDRIEPQLPKDRPVAVIGYPSFVPTTAALQSDRRFSQRWELYFNGCELCNCYTEETDVSRLRSVLKNEAAVQGAPADEEFIEACGRLGLCSGNALGVDRLLMILLEKNNIEEILIPC